MFGCTLSVCAFCKSSVVVSSGVKCKWSCSGGGLWRNSVSVCLHNHFNSSCYFSDIFSNLERSQLEELKMKVCVSAFM